MTARWIDVSNNNNEQGLGTTPSCRSGDQPLKYNVDWQQVAEAGYEGAFVKAGEGSTYTDPFCAGNLKLARANGLGLGAYYFAHPGQTDAKSAALRYVGTIRTLCEQAGIDPRSILHALDFEVNEGLLGNTLAQWAVVWCETVELELGLARNSVVFYSYRAFIDNNLGPAAAQLVGWRLWLADYTAQEPSGAPWTGIWMWQHTDNTPVPGVLAACDENYRYGPLDAQEAEDMRPFKLTTPDGTSAWYVTTSGAVYGMGPSAHYYGGLNNHPEWNAGGPSDPVIDVIPFADPKGPGYTVVTLAGDGPHTYSFGPSHNYA